MAIPINNYSEFEELVDRLWNQTPLFEDYRADHPVGSDSFDQHSPVDSN